jgi:catechol 2,3-dioxygenase-like lactoylglutathione lyase family enzyme
MTAKLHHIAVRTDHFDETVRFFREVFGMEVSRQEGTAPGRQLWFHQGIQVNETTDPRKDSYLYHHIGLLVDNVAEAMEAAVAYGCKPVEGKNGWFRTEDGLVIELKE